MSCQDFSVKSYSTGESNWILLSDSDWLTFSSPYGEKKKTLDRLMERGQDMFGVQVPWLSSLNTKYSQSEVPQLRIRIQGNKSPSNKLKPGKIIWVYSLFYPQVTVVTTLQSFGTTSWSLVVDLNCGTVGCESKIHRRNQKKKKNLFPILYSQSNEWIIKMRQN